MLFGLEVETEREKNVKKKERGVGLVGFFDFEGFFLLMSFMSFERGEGNLEVRDREMVWKKRRSNRLCTSDLTASLLVYLSML